MSDKGDRDYFLIRMSYLNNFWFAREQNLVAIAWSDINLEECGNLNTAKAKYSEVWQKKIESSFSTCANIFYSVKEGDIILTPEPNTRNIVIFEVVAKDGKVKGYSSDSELYDKDSSNYINVKEVKSFTRYNELLSSKLRARLKCRQTGSYLNDFYENIELLLSDKPVDKIKADKAATAVENYEKSIRDTLFGALTKNEGTLSPKGFEIFMIEVLRKIGFEDVVIPPKTGINTNGTDIDISATYRMPLCEPYTYYFQLKNHQNFSNKTAIEQLLFDNDSDNLIKVAITTAEFNEEAEQLAKKHGIEIMGKEELLDFIMPVIGKLDNEFLYKVNLYKTDSGQIIPL